MTLCDLYAVLNIVARSEDFSKRDCLLAAFVTGYYGLLKIGEYCVNKRNGANNHCLQRDNVRRLGDGSYLLTITSSKSGVAGQDAFVAIKPRQGDRFCPSLLISKYLESRGSDPGPLYMIKKVPLSRETLTTELSTAARATGLDAARIKPHSLRIGGATLALQLGLSDAQVRALGRWRSDAFLRYLRPTI